MGYEDKEKLWTYIVDLKREEEKPPIDGLPGYWVQRINGENTYYWDISFDKEKKQIRWTNKEASKTNEYHTANLERLWNFFSSIYIGKREYVDTNWESYSVYVWALGDLVETIGVSKNKSKDGKKKFEFRLTEKGKEFFVGSDNYIPVNEDLFASILAELSYRQQKNATNQYRLSDWGDAEDEQGWYLEVKTSNSEDDSWSVVLKEGTEERKVYSCPSGMISWEQKESIQGEIKKALGDKVKEPPEIWWGMHTKNWNMSQKENVSYASKAIENKFVGIGFSVLGTDWSDLSIASSLTMDVIEAFYHQTRKADGSRKGGTNEVGAFLGVIRPGDLCWLLSDKSYYGKFKQANLNEVRKLQEINIEHFLRPINWTKSSEDKIEAKIQTDLQTQNIISDFKLDASIHGTLKILKRHNESNEISFNQGIGVETYVPLFLDYLKQRAKVLDPTSWALLLYLKERSIQQKKEKIKQQETQDTYDILTRHKTVILEGVPGTGKTFLYKELKSKFAVTKFLTFHPSTDYSDFIGGLKPNVAGEKLVFEKIDGHLLDMIQHAKNGSVLLWIDEINRANISRVFGELISLLGTENPPNLKIPNVQMDKLFDTDEERKAVFQNLHIVGTMNTSDRSVTPMDQALRRRFKFIRLEPFDKERIENDAVLSTKVNDGNIKAYLALNSLLKEVLGRDYLIGHSYLFEMVEAKWDADEVRNIWKYSILPNIIDSLMITQKMNEILKDENKKLLDKINDIIKENDISLEIKSEGEGFNTVLLVTDFTRSEKDSKEEIIELLRLKQNVVLEGVPGTGKTFVITQTDTDGNNIFVQQWKDITGRELINWNGGDVSNTVTFHPASTYEDFIYGIFPETSKETTEIVFKPHEGILLKIAEAAKADPSNDYLLLIDEINRANIPKVMGELLTAIEKSKRFPVNGEQVSSDSEDFPWKIKIQDKELILPDNLYILATLNTSDRSVISMDSALRRRFGYYRMESLLQEEQKDFFKEIDESVIEALIAINKKLSTIGPDAILGHSYVFDFKAGKYRNVSELFQISILPQIADILNSVATNKTSSYVTELNNTIKDLNIGYQLEYSLQDNTVFVTKA